MRVAIRAIPPATTILCLLVALPACSVTWRQPEVQPLRPSRVFPTDPESVCNAIEPALRTLGLEIASATPDPAACLFETKEHRLGDSGEPINHLHEVAYVGNQKTFDHGRYLLTVSARPGGERTIVRVTARIEGYEGGYRLLRSKGLIEKTFFARLADAVGVDPLPQ